MTKTPLTPAQRLIVAADFKPKAPDGRKWVWQQVTDLAKALKNTGIVLKVNSALRACGYDLIDAIHQLGLQVFADLKLTDVDKTLELDGALLQETRPEIVTAMCTSGKKPLRALGAELSHTEVLGVTVLTSIDNDEADEMFACTIKDAVGKFAKVGAAGKIGGFISSAKELDGLLPEFGAFMSFNTPAIRPHWYASQVKEHQVAERITTPKEAIWLGADRIVVGGPILQASDQLLAVRKTIIEIQEGLACRPSSTPR